MSRRRWGRAASGSRARRAAWPACRALHRHQVARHEVAVHVDRGHGQHAGHDQVEGFSQDLLLAVVQGEALVLPEVPVGEELQFAAQHGLVVGRQHAGAAGLLPGQQGGQGVAVEVCVGLGLRGVDDVQHGLRAQVVEQQEAVGPVPVKHLRTRRPAARISSAMRTKGSLFSLSGGVSIAAGLVVQPQVAAKANRPRPGQASGDRGGWPQRREPEWKAASRCGSAATVVGDRVMAGDVGAGRQARQAPWSNPADSTNASNASVRGERRRARS